MIKVGGIIDEAALKILFVLGTLGSVTAAILVISGRFDGLSNNGAVSEVAYLSIVLYGC